jgi:FtsH ternary system domain X3
MPTRVRFRFNKVTGEIEEFLVDDQDRRLPEAEHDRIAAEVARMVAVSPGITPMDDASAGSAVAGTDAPEAPGREPIREDDPEHDREDDPEVSNES